MVGVLSGTGVFDLIIVYYVFSFFRHLTINNLVKLMRNSLFLFMCRRRERVDSAELSRAVGGLLGRSAFSLPPKANPFDWMEKGKQ